ncbi:branched-chain-amino-acid aminotransferase, cytosolic-like [Scleropages formosus]|uniref:Branched-chain-amino-acid aminotransferase n=1 Tax=Scleropages formosus TaxID=113540 RepID=A0A0P7XXS3_SCLFO|nr:branched-chain-amino-acid aminotransferase, cytosolic-like [Scleropages formosus]
MHSVLWLYGEDHQITEAGTMNLFLHWINEDGEEELATPPLDGVILPGITRQSIIELAQKWGEFKVSERSITMAHLERALKENRVMELFGSGTACVVSPVGHIMYQGKSLHLPWQENTPRLSSRLLKELTDIQVSPFSTPSAVWCVEPISCIWLLCTAYGRIPSDWSFLV